MTRRTQQGLSLVELMVAMVISLVLLAGVVQIYIANSQTNRIQEANARVQENGRFAVQFLSRDVRGAGYSGCVPTELLQVDIRATAGSDDDVPGTEDSLEGFDSVDSGNAWGAAAGSDVVRITGAMNANAKLAGNMTSDNANIQVTGNPNNWEAGDLLFIADCENGDLFETTNVSQNGGGTGITIAHSASGNVSPKLSKVYGQDARVLQFQDIVYFVRDTGRDAPDGSPIRALYREIDGGAPQELIEGVSDLQIVYGQDTDESGDIDRYVTADALGGGDDWAQVLAVRMELLIESTEANVLDDPQQYFFDGEVIGDDAGESALIDDRRLRRVFTTTSVIRNRTP